MAHKLANHTLAVRHSIETADVVCLIEHIENQLRARPSGQPETVIEVQSEIVDWDVGIDPPFNVGGLECCGSSSECWIPTAHTNEVPGQAALGVSFGTGRISTPFQS